MKLSARSTAVLLALALLSAPATLRALPENEVQAGRDLVKHCANSIIGIEMVVTLKMTMGDRAMPPREIKIDINGTVLNSAGLTVTSLTAIDPRMQFESMRANMGPTGARMEVGETDFKEVKLRLSDGSELPARVVLKDGDLDLAFIAPEADPTADKHEFTPVKLSEPAEGMLLNTYFIISRAPKVLQRVPLVRPTLVVGIVEKPRRMFLMTDQQIGCPIFDQQGRVLGISVHHLTSSRSNGLIVLPAADVAEIAQQAAVEAAKPPPPKPAVENPAPEKPAVTPTPAPVPSPGPVPAPPAADPGPKK
jgi:trypsin-like peptidase